MHNRIIVLTGIFILFIYHGFAFSEEKPVQASLKGKVTSETGEPLAGAAIYFPELKKGILADSDGNYSIENLPPVKLMIQVNSLGFKSYTGQVNLAETRELNVVLKKSVTEIGEIVVTGQPGVTEQKRTPSPIEIVSRSELNQRPSTNMIDAIADRPGVSQITTGTGISKPVIRGLGYNRVVVVHQGIRQEGQQWGDEHGTEIDAFDVDRVEILKGPASLAYGSDAMAGVINLLPAPSLPEGTVSGNISSNYQTNNGLAASSVHIAGNRKGLIWDARVSGKLAHAYENKYDGPVYNSGFRENAASLLLGLNRSWGFSHLTMSLYHLKPGMIEGERDSVSGEFLKVTEMPDGEETEEIAGSSDFKSYQPDAPFQKVSHSKITWNTSIYSGADNFESTVGFQQNRRKEFEEEDSYGLFFLLNTLNYDIRYRHSGADGWKLTTGLNGMWQKSENKGSEFLVPAYHLFDWGIFGILNKEWDKLSLSGGIRFDRRYLSTDALFLDPEGNPVPPTDAEAEIHFPAFDRTFRGFSGSLGAAYQISETIHTRLNLSRGFRAPNIAEMGSNGEHEGTFRYEVGNPELKPESSLQLDWGLGLTTNHITSEISLFHNTVDHYIFSHRLLKTNGQDSLIDDLPVFLFTQGKARLAGGEFVLDIHPHPLDWLHIENTVSYTHAVLKDQPDSSRYLPMIPPFRWTSVIRTDFDRVNRIMSHAYLRFGLEFNAAQDHYYAAYGTETRTSAYTLLSIGAGTDFTVNRRTLFSLHIAVSNLTNTAYQNHLSRLKYAGFNYNTDRPGIYNMGRNVSFSLLIPFQVSGNR